MRSTRRLNRFHMVQHTIDLLSVPPWLCSDENKILPLILSIVLSLIHFYSGGGQGGLIVKLSSNHLQVWFFYCTYGEVSSGTFIVDIKLDFLQYADMIETNFEAAEYA